MVDQELAELKAFNLVLAILVILSWCFFFGILGYIIYQVNVLPTKVANELNNQLNFTPLK